MTKINYEMIYNYLRERSGKVVTPSGIAYAIGVDRLYGATMTKLVRDGYLKKCPAAGYYRVVM